MYLQYGDYSHDENEVEIKIDRSALLDRNGSPYGYKETWAIDGKIQANTQALLSSKLRRLEQAYSINNQDATLYTQNGGPSVHQLLASNSISGVLVKKPPSFPTGKGAEYSTFRTYSINLEAEFRTDNSTNILEYTESVTTQGTGGPKIVHQEVVSGLPVTQQVSTNSVVRVTQSGSAVGINEYPQFPPAYFPGAYVPESSSQTTTSPKLKNGVYTDYRIAWNYQFALRTFPGTLRPRF